MKDLEKIKSEDLGCQVADANPGNFAIEQEVAQLVGATVPAPTEPSEDDARELGAQLLVFLRRALTPIKSALRTAVAAIYAHLDSRCTDYTPAAYDPFRLPAGPYDPMRPFVPRTLPNLLTALTAFSARKISGVPEAADGISLVHLACSDLRSQITELTDDTEGWTFKSDAIFNIFSNLTKVQLGCSDVYGTLLNNRSFTQFSTPHLKVLNGDGRSIVYANNSLLLQQVTIEDLEEINDIGSATSVRIFTSNSVVEELTVKDLKKAYKYGGYTYDVYGQIATGCSALKKVSLPSMETWDSGPLVGSAPNLEEILMEKVSYLKLRGWGGLCSTHLGSYPKVWKIVFGTLEYYDNAALSFGTSKLRHLEIGAGTAISLNFANWTPDAETIAHQDFLQNFREHIALRLAQQPADNPNHLTLTLSQAVFDTIWNQDGTPKSTDPDSVIYQINKIIKTDKHWSVNRA